MANELKHYTFARRSDKLNDVGDGPFETPERITSLGIAALQLREDYQMSDLGITVVRGKPFIDTSERLLHKGLLPVGVHLRLDPNNDIARFIRVDMAHQSSGLALVSKIEVFDHDFADEPDWRYWGSSFNWKTPGGSDVDMAFFAPPTINFIHNLRFSFAERTKAKF